MTRFTVMPDAPSVCHTTADRIVALATDAIAERGIFRIALSGGSTPKQVYPLLLEPERRDAIDWSRVEFFWGDERAVPPDDPESNYGVAWEMLLSRLPDVRPERIHRMPAERPDLDAAARDYDAELREAFGVTGSEVPVFDLIWLGMGPDGHTASLFPGSTGLAITDRWVVANFAPALGMWRMTLTFPVLNAARHVIFGVLGANKRDAMTRIRAGDTELPAARVHASDVEWLIDAAAYGEEAA